MSELRDPEVIRQDIEDSRRQLGDAVEALVARVNVKAMARAQAEGVRSSARGVCHRAVEHRTLLIAAAGLVVVLIAVRRGASAPAD